MRRVQQVRLLRLPDSEARSRGLASLKRLETARECGGIFVDFESPAVMRVLARFLRPARDGSRDALVQFTEMLPGPGDCWLEGDAGRYTSELCLVAVDLQRRSAARLGRSSE